MTPYQILTLAAKSHPQQSLLEVWNDFASWERARAFRDDPNASSKEDIEWVKLLYELAVRLEPRDENSRRGNPSSGHVREACRNALEAAAAAFAQLDHEPDLTDALVRWHQRRMAEAEEGSQMNAASSLAP